MFMTLKKAWYIEGYTMNGNTYCRSCIADTYDDEELNDPYNTVEDIVFTPIFASDVSQDELELMYCEYCFESLA